MLLNRTILLKFQTSELQPLLEYSFGGRRILPTSQGTYQTKYSLQLHVVISFREVLKTIFFIFLYLSDVQDPTSINSPGSQLPIHHGSALTLGSLSCRINNLSKWYHIVYFPKSEYQISSFFLLSLTQSLNQICFLISKISELPYFK